VRIRLDDDAAYEAFQLWWIALAYASSWPAAAAARARVRNKLRASGVRAGNAWAMVPRSESEVVEFDDGERHALGQAMCEVPWHPARVPDVIAAGRLIMCDLGRPGEDRGSLLYSVMTIR
jgi:hypothetical protein